MATLGEAPLNRLTLANWIVDRRSPTAAQAAAWTAVSRVLLNLDETVTKE